jgi:hypothetical protein
MTLPVAVRYPATDFYLPYPGKVIYFQFLEGALSMSYYHFEKNSRKLKLAGFLRILKARNLKGPKNTEETTIKQISFIEN